MTFWEKGKDEIFDPTVPGTYEMLGDMQAAVSVLTREQAMDRCIYVILQDIDDLSKSPKLYDMRRIPVLKENLFSDERNKYVAKPVTREHYQLINAARNDFAIEGDFISWMGGAWWVYESDIGWKKLMNHPLLLEDGTWDLDFEDRTAFWIGIDFQEHEIWIQNFVAAPHRMMFFRPIRTSVSNHYFHALDSEDLIRIALRMSLRYGMPILPWSPYVDGRTDYLGEFSKVHVFWKKWARSIASCPEVPPGKYLNDAYLDRLDIEFLSGLVGVDVISGLLNWITLLDGWDAHLAPPGYSWRKRVLDSPPETPGWCKPGALS